VNVRLSRAQLEKLCSPLFRQMRSALDRCCWLAGVDLMNLKEGKESKGVQIKSRHPLSEILLVGGATKMPAVRRFLKNMTGIEVRDFVVDPDQAVALGAAIEAGRLGGDLSEEFMTMDIWQASLMRALATEQMSEE